jgi:hypothetical protein
MSETKLWVFTLTKYTTSEIERVLAFLSSGDVSYGVIGREVGASGTPHLHGFLILRHPRNMSYLKQHVSHRAHIEHRPRSVTNENARDYCMKNGDFQEFGDIRDLGQNLARATS